ncbi:hypothetical protein G3576_24015, partial [Roseomonas stagni]|nr:hypothetical protein [Falsiroseomonas algicola]
PGVVAQPPAQVPPGATVNAVPIAVPPRPQRPGVVAQPPGQVPPGATVNAVPIAVPPQPQRPGVVAQPPGQVPPGATVNAVPIAVPPQPQRPGVVAQPPAQVPPGATVNAVPIAVPPQPQRPGVVAQPPGQVPPGATAMAVPIAVPPLQGPQQVLVMQGPMVARPRPGSGVGAPGTTPTVTIQPAAGTGAGLPAGPGMITRAPGRQALHDAPHFDGGAAGGSWNCYASGHSPRRHVDEEGRQVLRGIYPNMLSAGGLLRDVPALHEGHAECLIAVHRRPEPTAPR